MQPPSLLKRMRPFLELLWRATLLFPFYFALMILWLGAACAMLVLPFVGLLYIGTGDWAGGLLFFVEGACAFWIWRFLNRRVWETPDSLL